MLKKIVLTGGKLDQNQYHRHSGYIGGLKSISAGDLKEKRPEDLIRFAVRGMLPKNRLGKKQLKKLKVYAGDQHPHEAQNPEVITLKTQYRILRNSKMNQENQLLCHRQTPSCHFQNMDNAGQRRNHYQ